MLRLLFCTASIVPIAFIPWMTTKAKPVPAVETSYYDTADLELLSQCAADDIPVFFHDNLITSHSADDINTSLIAASDCGDMTVTVVPVLPDYADDRDLALADRRATQLLAHVDQVAEQTNTDMRLEIVNPPLREDISTLYINGRAAILRIEPDADAG